MSENQHDLATEFPEYKQVIHDLKISNAHFRHLMEQYHTINKQLTRAEQRIDLLSEIEEERLRKERLMIKDRIYGIISNTD